ncbi:restriction endonuclease subunit S [Roseburia sp. OM04-10BH]|nr:MULTISPECIES: restriction endonuclease subunit S [unclassified Roseburia]RGI46306.1 restriction endonuclease subunit S [Roseburia sp. OM04-10BH]RHV43584.1 restriction endonuclease subunit S [Roseburia sp. OM04-15AA]
MAEMKDSGIEWIGMIPKNWNVDKIKYHLKRNEPKNPGNVEVLSVYREYGVIPKNSRDDNHNITSEDTSKYKYVKKGDLVINKMKAWQGSMGVSEYEGIVSPAYFVYNFTDNYFDKKYFHFLIRNCYKDEFRRISGGIREGQWDLSADLFANELVLIPPIKEQIKIVEFLNTKCAEIDTLYSDIEKQIETLEEYKKSIITEAVTKGLDPDVEMKDSGIELIGQIPNEWKISRLGWISKKIGDGIHGTVTFEDGETNFYFINGNNIKKRNIAIKDNTQRITERIYNTYKTNLTTHTILISLNGTIGNLAFYNNENVLLGKSVGFIELKEEYNREYIYYLLQANYIKTIFELSFAGTTINNLSLQTLRKTNVLLPPKTEQKKIVKYLDKKCAEIDGAIEEKKEQLDTLEQYKKSVIYEYVTGKKEVQ